VSDRVFLLDAKQVKEYLYNQRSILGDRWYLGKYESEDWFYWLNTADTLDDKLVGVMFQNGSVYSIEAEREDGGVRPALWLDLSSKRIEISGDGSEQYSYKLHLD
jgi:hypothetical protein